MALEWTHGGPSPEQHLAVTVYRRYAIVCPLASVHMGLKNATQVIPGLRARKVSRHMSIR